MKLFLALSLLNSFHSFAQDKRPKSIKIASTCAGIRLPFIDIANSGFEKLSKLQPLAFDIDALDFDNPKDAKKTALLEQHQEFQSLIYTTSETGGQLRTLCGLLIDHFDERSDKKGLLNQVQPIFDELKSAGKRKVNSDLSLVGLDSKELFKDREKYLNKLSKLIFD